MEQGQQEVGQAWVHSDGCFPFYQFYQLEAIMINGITPSGARAVQLTHLAHFRRLQQIEALHPTPPSDPELLQTLRTHRHNHQHSRRLRQYTQAQQLTRENQAHRQKLQQIRMGRSKYSPERGRGFSGSVAHNFYNRKRMEVKIEVENPEIARRLIEMQGSISTAKTQQEYERIRAIAARLEKFPVIDRLSSLWHKTKPLKTEGDIPSVVTKESRVWPGSTKPSARGPTKIRHVPF